MFRRLRRILLILGASLLGLVLTAILVGYVILRSSQPRNAAGELAALMGPGPAEFRLELVP
jgi:hypothetical protein